MNKQEYAQIYRISSEIKVLLIWCWLWFNVTFSDISAYSDGADVQFPNFDLLPGTQAMGS